MDKIIDKNKINLNKAEQFHYEYIVQNRVIKLFQDQTKLIIAKDHTVSRELVNELKFQFKNINLEFKTVSQKEFDELLREVTNKDYSDDLKIKSGDYKEEDLTKLASDAPVINMVNEMFLNAVEKKASDIHIEVFENYFRVRYRINGYLQTVSTFPMKLFDAVCARIKVLSKLDITQRRLPQDGKAILNLYDKKIDVRTSTLPTIYGESIVLRLLGLEDNFTDLINLGYDNNDIDVLKTIIDRSYGAFILTGPTGSGKTTTLHALLHMLDNKTKNIVTVEDPVEYTIEGINQVQINEKIGYSFVNILRNILRQDPDIIMIGEMRDIETADIALRSAMTGHLVLTTLHTNDSIGSIVRLVNMGVERYVIESSVIACAAQRLVRILCPKCKQKYTISKKEKELFKKYNITADDINLFKPKGCPECNNTGFKNRTGVFEIFQMDEKLREYIINKEPISKIRDHLLAKNFVSMFAKGIKKCADGIFYLDEVKSIISEVF